MEGSRTRATAGTAAPADPPEGVGVAIAGVDGRAAPWLRWLSRQAGHSGTRTVRLASTWTVARCDAQAAIASDAGNAASEWSWTAA